MATQFDANNAQNLMEIEKQFAVKAVEHAQTYWNLLEKVPPGELRLTKYDDEMFNELFEIFPELKDNDHAKLIRLDEDALKSDDGKAKWRKYFASYDKKIKDHNFGSLIRTNAQDEYSETNTVFVTRIQFYAIEIARNRLGLNDKAHELAKAEKLKELHDKEKERVAKAKKSKK